MKIEAESKFTVGDIVALKAGAALGTRAVFHVVQVLSITCTAGTQICYHLRHVDDRSIGAQLFEANECELVPLTDELAEEIRCHRNPYRRMENDLEKTRAPAPPSA